MKLDRQITLPEGYGAHMHALDDDFEISETDLNDGYYHMFLFFLIFFFFKHRKLRAGRTDVGSGISISLY
jgi:hypothetical protein